MDVTTGTSVYVPPQVVYDGTTDSPLPPEWDGTRSGVTEVVSFDMSKPLSSYRSLLQFLTTSNIQILDPDDISRDESNDRKGKRGNSMEVFQGTFNGAPVALKYFRWPHLDPHRPDQMKKMVNK